MLNQAASLFGDLASADGAAQHAPGDWAPVRARLDSDDIAVTPPLLSEAQCRQARAWFGDPGRFRSTVVMQRHGFGRGTYRTISRYRRPRSTSAERRTPGHMPWTSYGTAHAGRGVATATVRELCRLAAARHGLRTLRAATARDNAASQKVLAKAGFVPVGPADPADLGGKPGTWYRRDLVLTRSCIGDLRP